MVYFHVSRSPTSAIRGNQVASIRVLRMSKSKDEEVVGERQRSVIRWKGFGVDSVSLGGFSVLVVCARLI